MAKKKNEDDSGHGGSSNGRDQLSNMPTGSDPKRVNQIVDWFFMGPDTKPKFRSLKWVLAQEKKRPGSTGTVRSAGI